MNASQVAALRSTVVAAAVGSMGQIALTLAHHLYGAVIYTAPFRAHVVMIALPIAAVVAGALYLGWVLRRRAAGKWLLRLVALVMAVLLAAMVGGYEGGYNHILKDAFYFAGISAEWFDRLFPPPLYEKPDDILFEVTGALQFPVGLVVAIQAWRLWTAASHD